MIIKAVLETIPPTIGTLTVRFGGSTSIYTEDKQNTIINYEQSTIMNKVYQHIS